MVGNLKNLFSISTADQKNQSMEIPIQKEKVIGKKTYRQYGYEQAGRTGGNLESLITSLRAVTHQIKDKHAKDQDKQEVHKRAIAQEIESNQEKIKRIENDIILIEKEIEEKKGKIVEKQKAISDIKKDPSSLTEKSSNTISFYIGLAILIFLTLYLFVFYSSASYSAFFKNFTPDDDTIQQAIFDAQAIPKALYDGFGELLFILLIPFVFLGLGFLIHKFQEQKTIIGYFKVIFFIAITFFFDYLLAFDITKKIYEIKQSGSFDNLPDYNSEMAFSNVNFWIIIFAGFLVYIIWGFVFDFTMETYTRLDKVNNHINAIKDDIEKLEKEIADEKRKINVAYDNIQKITEECAKLKKELTSFYVNVTELKQDLTAFFEGWLQFVSGQDDAQTIDHKNVFDKFITQI